MGEKCNHYDFDQSMVLKVETPGWCMKSEENDQIGSNWHEDIIAWMCTGITYAVYCTFSNVIYLRETIRKWHRE